jgi:hypothetical protein
VAIIDFGAVLTQVWSLSTTAKGLTSPFTIPADCLISAFEFYCGPDTMANLPAVASVWVGTTSVPVTLRSSSDPFDIFAWSEEMIWRRFEFPPVQFTAGEIIWPLVFSPLASSGNSAYFQGSNEANDPERSIKKTADAVHWLNQSSVQTLWCRVYGTLL